jgi:hypothetical protein
MQSPPSRTEIWRGLGRESIDRLHSLSPENQKKLPICNKTIASEFVTWGIVNTTYHEDCMEPITIATLSTLFAVKALEKMGEKFGEGLVTTTGKAIETIRHYDPKLAISIEVGDKQVLKLGKARLEKIPAEPIVAEFLKAADAEPNKAFQAKLADAKAGKIVAVMAEGIEAEENINAQDMIQEIEPAGSKSVEATMLKNMKAGKDMDLRGSRQTIK